MDWVNYCIEVFCATMFGVVVIGFISEIVLGSWCRNRPLSKKSRQELGEYLKKCDAIEDAHNGVWWYKECN